MANTVLWNNATLGFRRSKKKVNTAARDGEIGRRASLTIPEPSFQNIIFFVSNGSFMARDDQYRTGSVAHDILRCAADQDMFESGRAVSGGHDQIRPMLESPRANLLTRMPDLKRGLHCEPLP